MPNFRPLASLAWEENEVTDARGMSCPIPSKLHPSLRFGKDKGVTLPGHVPEDQRVVDS